MTVEGLLDHVELNVSELVAATDFYDWFLQDLGYVPYQEWESGRSWMRNETYFVIVQVEAEHDGSGFHRKNVGLNHLAFHAASRERVDRMREMLLARGTTVLYDSPRPGADPYALYFEGPDRLKLEYVWREPTRA